VSALPPSWRILFQRVPHNSYILQHNFLGFWVSLRVSSYQALVYLHTIVNEES